MTARRSAVVRANRPDASQSPDHDHKGHQGPHDGESDLDPGAGPGDTRHEISTDEDHVHQQDETYQRENLSPYAIRALDHCSIQVISTSSRTISSRASATHS